MRARCATFALTIPALTPDSPSPRGAPHIDQSGPQTFPTKHVVSVEIAEFNNNVYHVLANKQLVPHKCGHQYICHNNNPAPKSAQKSQQIGGPIFRQNRLLVPWISVPGPKHTFLMVAQ